MSETIKKCSPNENSSDPVFREELEIEKLIENFHF